MVIPKTTISVSRRSGDENKSIGQLTHTPRRGKSERTRLSLNSSGYKIKHRLCFEHSFFPRFFSVPPQELIHLHAIWLLSTLELELEQALVFAQGVDECLIYPWSCPCIKLQQLLQNERSMKKTCQIIATKAAKRLIEENLLQNLQNVVSCVECFSGIYSIAEFCQNLC